MLNLAIMLVATSQASGVSEPARTPVPVPVPAPIVEHHYNPGARIVHTTYTCNDGPRSITIIYDRSPNRGQVSNMSRNGHIVTRSVLDRINAILAEQLTFVVGIYPQCGSTDDLMMVRGMRGRERAYIGVRWSESAATLDQVVE